MALSHYNSPINNSFLIKCEFNGDIKQLLMDLIDQIPIIHQNNYPNSNLNNCLIIISTRHQSIDDYLLLNSEFYKVSQSIHFPYKYQLTPLQTSPKHIMIRLFQNNKSLVRLIQNYKSINNDNITSMELIELVLKLIQVYNVDVDEHDVMELLQSYSNIRELVKEMIDDSQ
ncbi:hypothetical protein BN7_2894 [Wickerhamomyces ciferrii]|uniref:Uncharacterized protein n=1 Tax=Wickerhamomyces ciferrii (strain ATCC 14091 / BCRC 22168 / CBS 111 / JCM 3599 / NBRC 0793 / NRRL Y-1031 F-60-10) TaxID=1206466 RepID=K0KK87_WICCF|nr:uncharacterized protein BN7_2894 [Wickerhamomyces ciferrii]CCH43346.1 hypothetical protein BN7_2894 [Wickerhamomyces ciferrii]